MDVETILAFCNDGGKSNCRNHPGCFHSSLKDETDEARDLNGNLYKDASPKYAISQDAEQALVNARVSQLAGGIPNGRNPGSFSLSGGRPSELRNSERASGPQHRKSFVGADLHSIMDDQGKWPCNQSRLLTAACLLAKQKRQLPY